MAIVKLESKSFFRNTLKLLTGNIVGQLIIIAAIPIITRIYPPELFGAFALFVTCSQILISFSNLRYANAILKPKELNAAANLFWLALVVGFCISFLCWITIQLLPNTLFLGTWQIIRQHINLLCVSSYTGSVIIVFNFWLIRRNYFSCLGIVKIIQAFSSRTAIITIGLLYQVSSIGLILSFIIGQLASLMAMSYFAVRSEWQLLKHGFNFTNIKKQALQLRSFAFYSPSALFNSARREFPVLALAYFFDPVVVGYYALCQRIVGQPLNVMGDAISRSFFQKAAALHHKNKKIDSEVVQLLQLQLLLTLTPCVLIAVVSQELFCLIFGDDWRGAGVLFKIIWPFFLCPFLFRPLSVLFDLYGKQRQYMFFNLLLFIISASGFLIGVLYSNPLIAVSLFMLVNVFFYGVLIVKILEQAGCSLICSINLFSEHFYWSLLFGAVVWIGKVFWFEENLEAVLFCVALGCLYLLLKFKKIQEIFVELG